MTVDPIVSIVSITVAVLTGLATCIPLAVKLVQWAVALRGQGRCLFRVAGAGPRPA